MRRIFLIALTLFLTGCAGEPRVHAVVQDRAYSPSEFRYASQHKALRTIISGNPFPAPDRLVHNNILVAMQPENWWFSEAFTPRTRFTGVPADVDTSPYHVIVSLNPTDRTEPATYCLPPAEAPPTETSTRSVTARMAFCRDTVLLSTSHGTVDDIDGSTHPRFREMITSMTMALFPRREHDNDCGPLKRRHSC